MVSTFHGIESMKRALFAQQYAAHTAGHNVANANTAGYTRQRVNLTSSFPIEMPSLYASLTPGQMGTGVLIDSVTRLRDQFLDLQYRQENGFLGDWQVRENTLNKLESIFNEPSEASLSKVLNDFWNAWQVLANNPEDITPREVVVQRSIALAETFNDLARQLNNLQNDLELQMNATIKEANALLKQIADLNKDIVKVEARGQNANDLRDRRDLLVDMLSGLMNIEVTEEANGGYRIDIKGDTAGSVHTLVSADGMTTVAELGFAAGDETQDDSIQIVAINGVKLSTPVEVKDSITSGKIHGFLESRALVEEYHRDLDYWVDAFANAINDIHMSAKFYDDNGDPVTAQALFVKPDDTSPFTAETILFNSQLEQNPSEIAASEDQNFPGDGSVALKIAQLRTGVIQIKDFNGNVLSNSTLEDAYNALIGRLGIQTQEAHRNVENKNLLLTQTDLLRQSVSGVSLDEEMADLIRFQNAYNAAARTMTVVDEMLQRLIEGTGIVGR